MKKTLRIFSFLMVLVLALSVFTACEISSFIPGGDSSVTDPEDSNTPSGDGSEITVYWCQGQKILREDKVAPGTILTSWEPKVSGKEFIGWYANPGCTTKFDFTQPVTKDTEIYASFKTTGAVDEIEPTYADYYLIGTGVGSLSVSGWNHENSAANLGMTDAGNGTYSITIEFYAGDMFQICNGLSWDGQRGIGCIEGAALVEGSETQAEVKDAEGNVVFTGTQEYSNPITAWNITCAPGQDGKYTFTLDTVTNTITWKLVERLEHKEQAPVENAIYFIGTFNNWDPLGLTDEWKLTPSEDGKTWTGKLTITEDMYADWTLAEMGYSCVALKLYNAGNSTWIGFNGDSNLGLVAGVYEFTYYVDTNTFTYNLEGESPVVPEAPESEIIFVGTMNEWDTTNSTGEWALTEGEDGKTWTGTLEVTEDMYGEWTLEQLGYSCAALKLYDKGTSKWIANSGESDLYLTAGTYHFKYVVGESHFTYWADGEDEPTTPEVTVPTEESVVYLVPNSNWVSDDARFAAYIWNDAGPVWIDMTDSDGDGVYECTVPAGYSNIIFCRMNPATTENDWANKWDQTIDLTLSGNCFTINDGDWNNATGAWSTN